VCQKLIGSHLTVIMMMMMMMICTVVMHKIKKFSDVASQSKKTIKAADKELQTSALETGKSLALATILVLRRTSRFQVMSAGHR